MEGERQSSAKSINKPADYSFNQIKFADFTRAENRAECKVARWQRCLSPTYSQTAIIEESIHERANEPRNRVRV